MGSNLAAPEQQLRSAVEALARLPDTTVFGVSAFYQSDSLLPGQPRRIDLVLTCCLFEIRLGLVPIDRVPPGFEIISA